MGVELLGRHRGSLHKRFQHIADLLSDEVRYVNMRLEFRTHFFEEHPTKVGLCGICEGELHSSRVLLSAGGCWDSLERRWVAGTRPVLREQDYAPDGLCPAHVLVIEDSQIEGTTAFAEWLWCFSQGIPRPTALDVLAGKRRGGKTFLMVACVLAAAIACPLGRDKDGKEWPFVGWLVVPSYPEQREIHEDLLAVLRTSKSEVASALDTINLPSKWFRYRPNPHNCYQFLTGATIYLKSANNPDSLKQGRVDIIGMNEAQKIEGTSVVHSAGNNIDRGGLTILAANPPKKARGAWMLDIKSAWEEGRAVDPEDGLPVVRWFWVNPEKNRRINQPARRKYRILAGIIDPKLASADADNEWNQINEIVCPKWHAKLILHSIPELWENCTGEVIKAMSFRECLRHPSQYTSWGGMDFNKHPWMAASGLKAYRDPTRGVIVFVIDRELCSDPQDGKGWTEKEFSIDLHRLGWDPEEICWIGDPSGQWQSSEHRKRGGVKQGHSSFDLFRTQVEYEQDGQTIVIPPWDMFAPTTWKAKESKHYAHPRIVESVDDLNELMRDYRLFVLDTCPKTIEAFKKCPRGNNGGPDKTSDYNHIIDAVRYATHRALNAIEPKQPRRLGSGGVKAGGGLRRPSYGFGGKTRGSSGQMFG